MLTIKILAVALLVIFMVIIALTIIAVLRCKDEPVVMEDPTVDPFFNN